MAPPTIIPALPPPPGVQSNFVDPYSLRPYNDLCQALCLSICTILIVIRMYTSIQISKRLGSDDCTACVAWIGLLAYSGTIFATVTYGAGTHAWDVPKSNIRELSILNDVNQIIYGPIITITKISILLLYTKLFVSNRRSKTNRAIWALIWLTILFYLPITIVKIFQCTPIARVIDKTIPGTCINFVVLDYTTGVVNLASDVFIFVLPVESIWRLQLRTAQKIRISAAFATGLLAIAASAVRLAKSITVLTVEDTTYALFQIDLWTEVEIATGIICSCLPSLSAFIRHFYVKIKDKNKSTLDGPTAAYKYPSLFSSSRTSGPRKNRSIQSDGQWLHDEYLELTGLPNKANVGADPEGLITVIEGGTDSRYHQEESPISNPEMDQQILKSVRIDMHSS